MAMSYLKSMSTTLRGWLGMSLASFALLLVPTAARADWGAIAVNPATGAIGVSSGYGTAVAAKHRARQECGEGGCLAAVWVLNQYAALVLKRNGIFVVGIGLTKHLAFHKARERAHEQSARRVAWVYSG